MSTPLPAHLDDLLERMVREAGNPSPSASNTVHVFREALAEAYSEGHKAGRLQVGNHQWLIEDLDKAYSARKSREVPADSDKGDNFHA